MPNFSTMCGHMFGGRDFSSLYGNMATQQPQPTTYQGQIPSQQPYSGQSPWSNFSNFGLGSLWGGGSGQHPGLGSWFSPSYSRYEAPSSESVQEFAANQQQMHQQQMEQHRQQAEQRYQQGIEQQRYQNQLMEQQQGSGLDWGAQPRVHVPVPPPSTNPSRRADAIREHYHQQQYQQQQAQMASPSHAGMLSNYQQQPIGRDRMMSMIQGLF